MFRNENSFLNCVMEALDDKTNILSIEDEDEREAYLIQQRKLFATESLVSLCRQEMYDKTPKEIIKILKDPDVYLDPKLFVHLLEKYFECNIFIFTDEMVLPRHLQAYYRYVNENPCIYIFEHTGSESDKSKGNYPQCELIVRYNTKKDEEVKYLFSYDEAERIRNIYNKLNKSYVLNKEIKELVFPIPETVSIISQKIDSYGKTRQLNISFNDTNISILTTPIQPLQVKETSKQVYYVSNVETVMKFVKKIGIENVSQYISDGVVKEIHGIIGNVNIAIPVVKSKPIENMSLSDGNSEYLDGNKQDSLLSKYNFNKKLARYIVEYTIWLYSNYLHDNKIDKITIPNIVKFSKKKFIIDPSHPYGHVTKTFSKDSPILKNGKIVVPNEETIKRLIYTLRLNIQRNAYAVKKYYKKKYIQNYYLDITDFTYNSNEILLFGEDSVENLIKENNQTYILSSTIQIGKTEPYFFKNNLVDDKVYLAQNADSLEKAVYISKKWKKDGYNVGTYSKKSKQTSFVLYSFVDENNIRKISGDDDSDYKIISNNVNVFVALLEV